ncbi:DUF4350 domain-containing protein [Streptomyces profundus]|uniref:DUF4350 domain-containing protein n=1 Tax=Streptomyces profundus TaxID=2867410 RepID=UPI001D167F0B|nr:DUF4350 domain-containing protein [Streptomyces sp. MA3_2.13]UED86018.1 DUF4350 domain-containing protein [Streptomyces sp. MA3_2.13]
MSTTTRPDRPTALSPTARHLWRRGRGPLLAVVALVLAGLVLAVFNSGDSGTLHPRSSVPTGSRAIAELLAERDVPTTLAGTAAEAAEAVGPDSTLLIAHPEALTDHARRTLRQAARESGRVVLVAPGPTATEAFAPGVVVGPPVEATEREPGCAAPFAEAAGSARIGGYRYVLPADAPGAIACYPADGAATLALVPTAPSTDTVLLGTPELLHNDHLDELGNASLALQLLGAHPRLVWYLPSGEEAPNSADERSLTALLPAGWRWAALQLAIAGALAALWRARRLGPVIAERLPISVRASETTEGRARLYHQTNARDRAADALRAATRDRLAPLVGVPPAAAHESDALPAAIAARTGDTPTAVHGLLLGPPPADDRALIRLADQLDALARRVTHRTTDEPAAPTRSEPDPPDPTEGEDRSS